MFRPSDIIIDAFIARLRTSYTQIYGEGEAHHCETIAHVARMALARMALSNALYHNLDHTLLVTMVGHDILRGQIVRNGTVSSSEWVNFVCSLLCFATGFYRYACPGDDREHCVIDEKCNIIAVSVVVRRYHYFADAALGIVLAFGIWLFVRGISG